MKKSKIVTIGLVALSVNLGYGINKNIFKEVTEAKENVDLQTQSLYQQNPKNAADSTGKSSANNRHNTTRGAFGSFFRRSGSRSITRGGFGKVTASSNS